MSFDFQKALQNVEIKIKGRAAIVVCGICVLAFAFWVVLKDFTLHPLFSACCGIGILVAIMVLTGLGLFGEVRPEEIPPTSFFSVDKMNANIVVAHGISSQKDLMQLLRGTLGIRKLPTPSAQVSGSAANSKDYKPLTPPQAEGVILAIEKGIDSQLLRVAEQMGKQSEPELIPAADQSTMMEGRKDLLSE